MSDSKGVVTISSNPTAAEITIADQSGVEVTFAKAGYQPTTVKVDSRINGWYVGNIVFGGLIGWLIVDPLTGAMWTLNTEHVNGSLAEIIALDDTSSPQLRIVSLDSIPESERDEMIRVR